MKRSVASIKVKDVATLTERKAYAFVLGGAILWGTTGTAQTFIPETVDSFVVATMRLSIGGVVLLLLLLGLGQIHPSRWPLLTIVFVALALALFQVCFFSSVRLTGVAVGTVVSIGSAPIFSGLLEWVFLRRPPNRQWRIATALAIVGTGLLFLNKELVVIDPLGILFAFGAGFLFASYTFLNKEVLERVDTIEAIAVVFTLSALMLWPFFFQFRSEGLWTKPGIIAVLYIGLVTTALGYILFVQGLKYIPSSSATTLSLAEPFTATLLGVVVVGEYLNASAWLGVGLLMLGIVLVTLRPETLKRYR